jgi:hypothetical protein
MESARFIFLVWKAASEQASSLRQLFISLYPIALEFKIESTF